MKLWGSLLACAFALGGCIGDECDDVWSPDIKRGVVCVDEPGRCQQLVNQADRELLFTANIGTTGEGGSLSNRAFCVAEFIRQRGGTQIQIAPDNRTVTTVTTFRRVAPAFEFKSVTNFNVSCTPAGCANCATLAAEACQADAFCAPLSAQPYDAQTMCLAASRVVGCQPADASCDAALTWAANPTGTCHLFPDTCLPAGWTPGTSCPAAAVPACPM